MTPGEVHVWVADADAAGLDPSGRISLSADERERASRFRRDLDRNRWIASRVLLRRVLGGYTGQQPGRVEFRLGANDKPEVVAGEGARAPHFNLSHSGPMVVIGVAEEPVGVDIEEIKVLSDFDGLMRHVLRADELVAFEEVAERRRTETFFAVWTRKEAYLKARGRGIGGLRRVGVTVDADLAVLTHDDDDPQARTRFSLFDLDVGPGYRAAVAASGRPAVVVHSLEKSGDPGRA